MPPPCELPALMTKFCCASCQRRVRVAPGSGKSERVYESLTPLRNAWPSVVTMTVVLANSTPSAYATTVWTPSPKRFQLNSNPKPLSVSPHTWRVSPRLVP